MICWRDFKIYNAIFVFCYKDSTLDNLIIVCLLTIVSQSFWHYLHQECLPSLLYFFIQIFFQILHIVYYISDPGRGVNSSSLNKWIIKIHLCFLTCGFSSQLVEPNSHKYVVINYIIHSVIVKSSCRLFHVIIFGELKVK